MNQPPSGATTELAMPAGWVIDWISRDRLTRQLASAPDPVVGVGTATGPLPPGSSYRTHAERLALLPRTATTTVDRTPDVGVVLTRAGHGRQRATRSTATDGSIIIDHGTHAHDPTATPAEMLPAGAHARSPFPVRPVLLFLQVGAGDLDDRIRVLTNDLLSHDVEARVAAPTVPPGDHLTRPCAPVIASLAALCPDIVVPLDEDARSLVEEWERGQLTSVISVEIDEDVDGHALADWRRNSSNRPTRARVNPGIGADVLARLVNRLSSAPRPVRSVAVHLT